MSAVGERSLRQAALAGGRDLAVREVAGIVLSLLGTVVIFRTLGPEEYGYVGLGIAVSGYATLVGTLGLNTFVIRHEDLGEDSIRQVFTLSVALSALVCTVLVVGSPLVEAWTAKPDMSGLIRLVSVAVFARLVSQIPLAKLERNMRFDRVARIEFMSLVIYYPVAIALVLGGWSYWGVWIANVAQGIAMAGMTFRESPVRPATRVGRQLAAEALRFGTGYQASVWIWSLRDIAAPVIVARAVGMEALGLVSAATQIVQRLGFFRNVVWRVSLSGLSRVQANKEALRRGVSDGMAYQVLLLGGVLAAFLSVSGWAIPLVLGDTWSEVQLSLVVLALATIVNGVFSLHTSALFARGDVAGATRFHVAFVAVLWGVAAVLTPLFGLGGYLAAEIVALGTYWIAHREASRSFGSPDYRRAALMAPGILVPLLVSPFLDVRLGVLLFVGSVGATLAAVADSRSIVKEVFRALRPAVQQ